MVTDEALLMQNSWVQKRPTISGGDACLRHTRYNVWGLVEGRKLGLTDDEILCRHPDLTSSDLKAAWTYYAEHPQEIEQALWLTGRA